MSCIGLNLGSEKRYTNTQQADLNVLYRSFSLKNLHLVKVEVVWGVKNVYDVIPRVDAFNNATYNLKRPYTNDINDTKKTKLN